MNLKRVLVKKEQYETISDLGRYGPFGGPSILPLITRMHPDGFLITQKMES